MNYALDTPIQRSTWTPEEPKPVAIPAHSSQQTQTHRTLTWLHHKPQDHAIFPRQAESGRRNYQSK